MVNDLRKLKIALWIIGTLFMMLYSVYIAGYSASPVFKYALFIGLFFWSVELFIQLTQYSFALFKNIQKKN